LLLKNQFQILSAGKDKSIKIWDFKSVVTATLNIKDKKHNKENITLIKDSYRSEIGHDEEIMVLKASHNEKLFASGSFDKLIKVWNKELKLELTLTGHKRGITDLSFSKYAKILASSSTDKTIKLWNLSDGSCLNTLTGHLASVLKLHWIYYGTYIVSGKYILLNYY